MTSGPKILSSHFVDQRRRVLILPIFLLLCWTTARAVPPAEDVVTNGYAIPLRLNGGLLTISGSNSLPQISFEGMGEYTTNALVGGTGIEGFIAVNIGAGDSHTNQPHFYSNRVEALNLIQNGIGVADTNAVNAKADWFTNAASLFVDTNGNNLTASRGVREKPFQTIEAAVAAALPGDTVVINPGAYSVTNSTGSILKAGVNIDCVGSPVISLIDSGFGTGFGILDDRASGPTTNVVRGGIWQMIQTPVANGLTSRQTRGLVTITNAATVLDFRPTQVNIGNYNFSDITALSVENCRNVIFKAERIVDLYSGTTIPDPDGTGVLAPTAYGIYWNCGELYIDVPEIHTSGYALWCDKSPGNWTNNAWATGSEWESTGSAVWSPIYISSKDNTDSPNWRTWINVKQVSQTGTKGAGAVAYYIGTGRHYLTGLKLGATGSGSMVEGITVGSGYPNMNIELWADIQKISTRYAAIDVGRGAKATIKVHQIEELGASGQPRIFMDGGELDLNGQKMISTNSVGLSLSGGTARITGLRMDTSAGTNAPIFKSGGSLWLEGVKLVGPTTTNSISADAIQAVTMQNCYGAQPNSPNIVLATNGGFTIGTNTVFNNVSATLFTGNGAGLTNLTIAGPTFNPTQFSSAGGVTNLITGASVTNFNAYSSNSQPAITVNGAISIGGNILLTQAINGLRITSAAGNDTNLFVRAVTNSGGASLGNGVLTIGTAPGTDPQSGRVTLTDTLNNGTGSAGVVMNITGAGHSGKSQQALRLIFNAGYTGTGNTMAMVAINNNAALGAGMKEAQFNMGVDGEANGTTTGINTGIYGTAQGGTNNIGILGTSVTTKSSSTNIGGAFYAANSGAGAASANAIYAKLGVPPKGIATATNAVALLDNGTSGLPILIAQSNGQSVAWITGPGVVSTRSGVAYYQKNVFPTNDVPASSVSGTNFLQLSYGGLLRTVFTNYNLAGAFCEQVGTTIQAFNP